MTQINKFKNLNGQFASLGTGMTQWYKFRDRWWTLLLNKTRPLVAPSKNMQLQHRKTHVYSISISTKQASNRRGKSLQQDQLIVGTCSYNCWNIQKNASRTEIYQNPLIMRCNIQNESMQHLPKVNETSQSYVATSWEWRIHGNRSGEELQPWLHAHHPPLTSAPLLCL
jgi:hypothetical protein